jgi:anti-sigma factor RsiW
VVTGVLAWTTVLALCVAAFLFGQTARTSRRGWRRRSPAGRLGLFLSLSGPWLAVIGAGVLGALTGGWLAAAAVGAIGVVVAALVGLTLAPH